MPNQIDIPACANLWTEQQRDLFNKLDYYLAKTQVEYFKEFLTWQKLLKPVKWQANQGPVMKGVHKVHSPINRSEFLPNPLTSMPKKDVVQPRETTEQCQLYRHRFESELLHFLPSFQDFMTDHVDFTNKDLVRKIAVAQDLFLRTAIFHGSPYVWIASKTGGTQELTSAPYWTGYNVATSKSGAFLKDAINKVGSGLTLRQIAKLATVAEQDVKIPFFSGGINGDGSDGTGLKGKYLLLCSTEAWYNFTFDDFVLDNRALDLNIVTSGFTGSLFGRITAKFEDRPIRIAADGTIVAAPEVVEEGNVFNKGDVVPNPDYVNAPWEVAFLIGAEAYKSISIGPPPGKFASGEMDMAKFRAMDWNGKVIQTKDINVKCLDANNNEVYDTNKYGEYMQLISQAVMGVLPIARRYIIPIIFQRQRVGAQA